ncbi:MAG TPA: MFS transporter [Solirubrobacteraceae bacterium]|nr:MFS transporter [Solirubrobacteraceae bacterium]
MSKALKIGSFGQSWVVGSLLLGAIAGAILSGWLADAISRKWTKFLGGCVYTAAAIGSAFAPSIVFLCVARFVLGVAVGTASFVAPMYISEHAPKRVRGAMTTFNQFMITLGILIAYIADFALKGFSHNWRWMLAFGAVPGVALAVSMALVPHSPRWLLQQERRDEAAGVLEHSRDPDEIDDELDDIEEAVSAQESVGWRNLISPRVRPLLVVGLALAIFQQIIGINTIIYFGATVLHYMGYSVNVSVGEAVYLGIRAGDPRLGRPGWAPHGPGAAATPSGPGGRLIRARCPAQPAIAPRPQTPVDWLTSGDVSANNAFVQHMGACAGTVCPRGPARATGKEGDTCNSHFAGVAGRSPRRWRERWRRWPGSRWRSVRRPRRPNRTGAPIRTGQPIGVAPMPARAPIPASPAQRGAARMGTRSGSGR